MKRDYEALHISIATMEELDVLAQASIPGEPDALYPSSWYE